MTAERQRKALEFVDLHSDEELETLIELVVREATMRRICDLVESPKDENPVREQFSNLAAKAANVVSENYAKQAAKILNDAT